MRFITLLFVLVVCGCASQKGSDKPSTTVVTREYKNINIVGKDVTTEETKSGQAGAAITTDRYEVVLAKRQYEYANLEPKNKLNPKRIQNEETKNKLEPSGPVDETKKKKDESIYKKRDESMYRKE